MAKFWINKIIIVGGLGYLIFSLTIGSNDVLFNILLSIGLFLLILIEIFIGTVAESEKLMLSGNYLASNRELKGTLFPNLLLNSIKLRYYATKASVSAELGNLEVAKDSLEHSVKLGLDQTQLTFVLTKLLKGQQDSKEKIESLMNELKQIDQDSLSKTELVEKINALIKNKLA